jgi:hypothetical protein
LFAANDAAAVLASYLFCELLLFISDSWRSAGWLASQLAG